MKNKLNTKQKRFQKNRKAFILMTVLCMGIGFAFLSSNLTITGNTSVSGNSWNIYFTNVQVTEGSVDATVVPTTIGTNTTSLDYTVTLDKPGDFYEFTVDAVNNGTIDAMIQSINMTSLDSDVEKYLNYTANYVDGTPLAQNNFLGANSTVTYKIKVEFKKDIDAEDLNGETANLNLVFAINYTQYGGNQKMTSFTKLVRNAVLSDSTINFTNVSSTSNGRGIYVKSGTEEDTYPIYYYRGAVTNNNAKFAGFCWKVVRTTETGGTKLIYNGTPDANGKCTNTTGTSTQLATKSKFNGECTSEAYVGYMYGNVYGRSSTNIYNKSYVYGNTFTYKNGEYTLSNTSNGLDNTHHYTCFTDGNSCTTINYIYYKSGYTVYYISLTNGKSVEDAIAEMNTNSTNSLLKTTIDNWFNNTFRTYFTTNNKDYNDYLEDTVWCNDRSMNTIDVSIPTSGYNGNSSVNNGWIPNGGDIGNSLYYISSGRYGDGSPSLVCSNKNDSFTVAESSIGNGALTYPVGLLTADEILLAGGQSYQVAQSNTDFYLYTNQDWWSLSPSAFVRAGYAGVFLVETTGSFSDNDVCSYERGVRPSISIKKDVRIASGGDGTAETPYEFVVE